MDKDMMILDAIRVDDPEIIKHLNITDRDLLYDYLMMSAGNGSVRCLDFMLEKILEEGYEPPDFSEIAEEGINSIDIVKYVFEKSLDFFDKSEIGNDYWSGVIRFARRMNSYDVEEWLTTKLYFNK